MGPDTVRNLEVWREGMAVVREIYRITQSWPNEELYGLISQACRAAISIPANLAEGLGRGTPGEIARFSQTALSSAYELDTLLQIASDLGYLSAENAAPLRTMLDQLIKRIHAFVRYQDQKR